MSRRPARRPAWLWALPAAGLLLALLAAWMLVREPAVGPGATAQAPAAAGTATPAPAAAAPATQAQPPAAPTLAAPSEPPPAPPHEAALTPPNEPAQALLAAPAPPSATVPAPTPAAAMAPTPAAAMAQQALPESGWSFALPRTFADWALPALAATLAAALLLALVALQRQRRQLRGVLRQFSDGLDSGDWRDAVSQLRDEASHLPSSFDALAGGVESVLGESERRWQALTDLSADWYWETDRHHRLSWLSGSAPQALAPGLDTAALLGRRHDQIGHFRPPADGWAALHARMQRLESFRDLDFQIVGSPQTRWLSISGRPRRDAQGIVVGYEGVGRDISERRDAHERLIASEQRWSTMTRLAADWYWQTDAEHRLLPFDAEQHRRVGAAVAERIEGRTRWDAHRDALTPQQWAEHRADLDARRPFRSLHLEIDAGDGRWLWISVSGLPRFDGAQRFLGYHGVGRDITARKQAEALLLRHNETLRRAVDERTRELQQVNLDLDAFARQLAHELRTPIGQIQGLAQMLRERGTARLDDRDQVLLDLQVQAAHRMRDTVEALMALARSKLQPLPLQDVDLSALAHEVAADLPAPTRSAPLRWQIQDDMRVTANAAALRIVLANLMGNAAKFTRDCAEPWVSVGLSVEAGDRVRVRVQDNGVGFDPARAAQLFQPFSRLHKRDDYAGSGIGLSIVQRVVERHGGQVAARAEPGHGACFEFTLPRGEATAMAVVEARNAVAQPG